MQGGSDESKCLDSVPGDKFVAEGRPGYMSVDGVCLPQYYSKFEDAIQNFQVRDDDVWVISFPKSGTTWTQEMVWCIANDLDFERAKVLLSERFPFLEFSMFHNYMPDSRDPGLKLSKYATDSVSYTAELPSPRFIKSHLPYDFLPRQIRDGAKKPKIVYVSRNPKDTCISYFHHSKLFTGYEGDFGDFCKLFIAGKIGYAPYWKYAREYSSRRNDGNMLFLTYEDMKADLASVIRKVADFLGKSVDDVYDSKKVEALMNHLSYASMKVNPAVNYVALVDRLKALNMTGPDGAFIRSGETDQWKRDMTREMIDTFDEWIAQNTQGTCLEST